MCAAQGGAFSTSLCTRTNALGGGRTARGTMAPTIWYYPPGTSDQIRQLCAPVGATFVPP